MARPFLWLSLSRDGKTSPLAAKAGESGSDPKIMPYVTSLSYDEQLNSVLGPGSGLVPIFWIESLAAETAAGKQRKILFFRERDALAMWKNITDAQAEKGDIEMREPEVMVADLCEYERVAHLRTAPLPGGDLAARVPWRAALGYQSLEDGVEASFAGAYQGVASDEVRFARSQVQRSLNAPLASSMGRLFDAAAAILADWR